jgi:hypothetical protein
MWLVREGVPWIGRRAGDLTPWAARMAVSQFRSASASVSASRPAGSEVQRIQA